MTLPTAHVTQLPVLPVDPVVEDFAPLEPRPVVDVFAPLVAPRPVLPVSVVDAPVPVVPVDPATADVELVVPDEVLAAEVEPLVPEEVLMAEVDPLVPEEVLTAEVEPLAPEEMFEVLLEPLAPVDRVAVEPVVPTLAELEFEVEVAGLVVAVVAPVLLTALLLPEHADEAHPRITRLEVKKALRIAKLRRDSGPGFRPRHYSRTRLCVEPGPRAHRRPTLTERTRAPGSAGFLSRVPQPAGSACRGGWAGGVPGRISSKWAPGESSRSRSEPPCSTTIFRAMASPRPVPFSLVVKKGSKIWSRLASGTPGPSSFTVSRKPSPRALNSRRMVAPLGEASTAFRSRFNKTLRMAAGSRATSGISPWVERASVSPLVSSRGPESSEYSLSRSSGRTFSV